MTERRARAARFAALAVLLLCAGTCALWRTPKREPLAAPPPLPPAASTAAPMAATMGAPSPLRAPPAPPAPPIVDSIAVEKEEVCEGEENLVTIKAHTPDGNDAFLHYRIGPASGSAVPIRSYLDDRRQATPHRVTVFGKNNVATTVALPPFRVKACEPAPVVVIEHRLRPNTLAELDFDAHILSTAAKDADGAAASTFRARRFAWSFGDAARMETSVPHVTHDFTRRPQDTLYTTFLVTVEVLGEDGRVLKARHSVELLNPAFEAFAYKRVVVLFADLEPRFPVLSAGGTVDQGVRLWHVHPSVVEITKVTMTRTHADPSRRSPPEPLPVSSVLGATHVPPGKGIEFHVVLDTRSHPDELSRSFALEGRTPEGYVVRGAFSVMKPPPRPTKQQHEPIADPILLTKIKIAREVLHREFVTDEDLWTLERAGQFRDLRLDAGAPSSHARAVGPSLP